MDNLRNFLLAVNQFGYGARHFIVRLGKTSSGARYDDLKQLVCEIQVRTVVQDAWAIIQHHMVYKREAQVPTQLQRKLNSLAGLFETVDDQFERIREQREAYVAEVRDSTETPATFLENELNLDSFKEYLKWRFPDRTLETFDGQARMAFDGLMGAGYTKLSDVDKIVKQTAQDRSALIAKIEKEVLRADDGTIPAAIEPALALSLAVPNWKALLPWNPNSEFIIENHLKSLKVD